VLAYVILSSNIIPQNLARRELIITVLLLEVLFNISFSKNGNNKDLSPPFMENLIDYQIKEIVNARDENSSLEITINIQFNSLNLNQTKN
jgi:hypothetical protein